MAREGGAENQRDPPPPRNHSSNLEGSGCGGGFHTSPTFSAARESIAVISGSGSDNATTPEGGNAAELSSPEREGSPSDAATDIWSSGEAPKETGGVPHSAEAPVRTNGTPAGCGVPEGWEPPLGEALTVILRSPLTPPDAVPPRFLCQDERHVMITYNIYIVIRETGQFSSKGIINDFIGNLNRLTVSRRFTEQAV